MASECQYCGACCFSESSTYVPLTAADLVQLGDEGAGLLHHEDGGAYMAMRDGHCAALRVGTVVFSCTIYERRPQVCRELERGTPACREERRLKEATAARLQQDSAGTRFDE